ncbi:MAG TPA: OmpH family outer membrane protein [Rhizomicrobium sp.]|nr:OmpH family outer membrane protein [Rhizomicrobium sp.]
MKTLSALALAFAVFAPAAALAQGNPPGPRVVVIDKVAILQSSKVGLDVAKQVQALAEQARNELTAQGRAIQNEGRQLQQQVAILAPDLKQKRIAAFEAKQRSLQGAAQKKDEQIKGGFLRARQAMEQALGPILQEVVKERGANLVLDKQAVVFANNGAFDITREVIAKLDQKMPTYKVSLASAPAPSAPAQQ